MPYDDDAARRAFGTISERLTGRPDPALVRRRGQQLRHRRRICVAAGAAFAVAAIATIPIALSRQSQDTPKGLDTVAPIESTTTTLDAVAPAPLAGVFDEVAPIRDTGPSRAAIAWTGHEVVIAGGSDGGGAAFTNVAVAFDPATRAARELPALPVRANYGASGVWTGAQFVVLGGDMAPTSGPLQAQAYDPSTNAWTILPLSPLRARSDAAVAWTGTEVLVWGGFVVNVPLADAGPTNDGAAYNPSSRTWRLLPATTLNRSGGKVTVWTGTEWLLLGGPHSTDQGTATCTAYNSTTNSWRAVMSARCRDLTNAWLSGGRVVVESGGDTCARKLAYYDTETDTFTDISTVAPANARAECTTLYFADGSTVYAFDNSSTSTTRVLALVANNWVQIATGPMMPASTRFVALDPGHVMVFVHTTDSPSGRVLELRVEAHR